MMLNEERQSDETAADPTPLVPKPKAPAVNTQPIPSVGAITPATPTVPTATPAPVGSTITSQAPADSPVPAVGAVTPGADAIVPYQANSGLNTANPNATPGNPFSGMTSAEGGSFGPAAGTRQDASGILGILGGQPGQYDALAGRLAANPTLYKQWQGIMGNDPASVAAAIGSGDPELAKIAQDYAKRNSEDSGIAFGPQGQTWRDIASGSYKAPGAASSPFLSQPDLPVMGSTPSAAVPAVGAVGGAGTPATTPGAQPAPAGSTITSQAPPSGGATGAASGATGGASATGGMGNVARTTTNPGTALTTQTLSRAPGADRYQLALQGVSDWEKASKAGYEADQIDADRRAAGKGQLGSGMLRGAQRKLTADRGTQRDAVTNNYLRDALTGSIDDSFKDVGVAQQQQGFQQGQQGTAFDQALRQATTEDSLTGSAFQRALQQSIFGSAGNPGDTQLALANYYTRQGQGAGAAAGAQGKAAASSGGSNTYLDAIQKYLQSLGGGGSATPAGTPVTTGLPNA